MFSLYFWKATAERAVKSFAQSLVALLGVGQLGLLDVDWVSALSIAGMALVLSVLSSIGSASFGDPQDPSLVAAAPLRGVPRAMTQPGHSQPAGPGAS